MLDRQVLFAGNSLSYRGGGVDHHFSRLAPEWKTDRFVKGGAVLSDLTHGLVEYLERHTPGVLVLQEDLPETDVASFHHSVRTIFTHAEARGVQLLLFMTWPYDRLDWIDIGGIAEAHSSVSEKTGIPVAPVGLVWDRIMSLDTGCALYDADGEHPSETGSFVAACTIYPFLTGEYVTGKEAWPKGLDIRTREIIDQAIRSIVTVSGF